jgi:hypothetical protein
VLTGDGAGTNERTEIRAMGYVDRCGYGNDQKVGAGETTRIGCGLEPARTNRRLEALLADFACRIGMLVIGIDLRL